MSCTLTEGHNEGCEKAVYDLALASCTEAEGCESTAHKENCPAPLWAELERMLYELPEPNTVNPFDATQLETLHGQLQTVTDYAVEKGLYASVDEAACDPTVAALLDAMYPKNLTLEMNGYTLDFGWYGTGTAEVFEIDTVGELAAFAKITQGNVNMGGSAIIAKSDFSGKTVKLGADIAFGENEYWYNSDGTNFIIKDFAGTFDGNSKVISGLKFNNSDLTSDPQVGLFSKITGTVKNLTLNGVTATLNSYDKFGFIAVSLTGTASNCHVKNANASIAVNAKGTGYTSGSGGMFGAISSATVSGCTTDTMALTCYGSDNTDNVGALVGTASGSTITDCSVANINYDCTRKTKRTGGFIGSSSNTSISGCTAENITVTVDTYYQNVGGFVGTAGDGSTYSDCTVNGFTFVGNSTDYAGEAGGFAAVTSGTVSFNNCHVTGLDMTVTCNDNNNWGTGGFISWQEGNVTVDGCSVSGTIAADGTGGQSVGGLVGNAYRGSLTITDSSAADVTVSASGTAGGMVGKVESPSVSLIGSSAASSVTTGGVAGALVGNDDAAGNIAFGDCVPPTTLSSTATNELTGVAAIDGLEYTSLSAALAAAKAADNGTEIVLLDDLTLDNWTAVNMGGSSFTLNGNGKTISGLNAPLLDSLSGTVLIKNVSFTGANIEVTSASGSDADSAAAVVVAWAYSCDLTLENVNVENSAVKADGYVGALVGFAQANTQISTNGCTVSDVNLTAGGAVGTFIGHSYATGTINGKVSGTNTITTTSDSNSRPDKAGIVIGRVTAPGNHEIDVTVESGSTLAPEGTNAQRIIGSIPSGAAVISGGSYTGNPLLVENGNAPTLKARFEIIENNGSYTVEKILIPLTVVELTATNRSYDGTVNVALSGGRLSGVQDGDEVSAVAMPTTGTVADANVGNGKTVSFAAITLTGADAEWYVLTQPAVTVDITAATLTATYEGETIIYGKTPALAVKVDGFVNGETAEALAQLGDYTAPTVANSNTALGSYTLSPANGAAKNYIFTYESGTLTIAAPVNYSIIEGADQTVTKGNAATFVSNADFSKFVELQVDGDVVEPANYIAVSGSTKVTLRAEYINTLKAKTHTLTVVSDDGSASTAFTVKKAATKIPVTGDNSRLGLWIAVFVASAMTMALLMLPKQKKGRHMRVKGR